MGHVLVWALNVLKQTFEVQIHFLFYIAKGYIEPTFEYL